MLEFNAVAAVLFDMDGTLVDSDAAVARGWVVWSGEYGVDADAVIALAHGSPSETTIRKLFPDLAEDAIRAAVDRHNDIECGDASDVRATPGAHDLIALLTDRGLPWAVVTSADTRLARVRLAAAGITPPVLVTVDDIPAGKPDPAGYLRAAALLGVDAADCLVVEDAEVGLAAGRAAGARTAALRGLDGDLRPTTLADLTPYLA